MRTARTLRRRWATTGVALLSLGTLVGACGGGGGQPDTGTLIEGFLRSQSLPEMQTPRMIAVDSNTE